MGFFDKMFSGLSKTRKNMIELEELFQDYAPDRLIIMYAEDIGKEPLIKAIQKYKAEILYDQ